MELISTNGHKDTDCVGPLTVVNLTWEKFAGF